MNTLLRVFLSLFLIFGCLFYSVLSAELVGGGSLISKQDQIDDIHIGKPSSYIVHSTRPVSGPQSSKYKGNSQCKPDDEDTGCVDIQIDIQSVPTTITVNDQPPIEIAVSGLYTFRNLKTNTDDGYRVEFKTDKAINANFTFWTKGDENKYLLICEEAHFSAIPDLDYCFSTSSQISTADFTSNYGTRVKLFYYPHG
jgi:hypothetical protein